MRSPADSKLPRLFGFSDESPEETKLFAAAMALALPLLGLPVLLLLPLDTDRALPLAFLPAVWMGWKVNRSAHRIDAWLLAWAIAAMLVSAILSPHTARAFVMTAAVGWTLMGGFVARNLATSAAAIRLVLGGITAGAALGTVMLRLGIDAPSSTFPIYGNARLFGAHQFAGCACAIALLASPRPGMAVRMLTGLTALITFTGLFWSGSRAPITALTLMLALWFWRGTARERHALLRWTPPLVIAALVISFFLGRPYPGMGWSVAVERTVEATSIAQVSSERSRFWTETWHYALASPWIGHGADGYRFVRPAQNGSQPHNMLLQWFIEYGVLGMIPLSALLLRGTRALVARRSSSDEPETSPFHSWAPATLAGTAAYGLLDGVFYHATIFMPAAVITGIALGIPSPSSEISQHQPRLHLLLRPLLLGALIVILLHGWLGLMLRRAPHVTSGSMPARMLRLFPSTTAGLQNWIERWRPTQPAVAMDWIKWAQTVSVDSAAFHVHAAQIYIWEKNYKAAEIELLHCLEKVHHLERPDVQTALTTVRALDAGKPFPQPSP
jgi:O-antigen ligase